MMTTMLIIYVIGAIAGSVVLQLIVDRVTDRYTMMPSSTSLLWMLIFLILGFGFIVYFFIPIIYHIFMFYKYSKLEERVTPALLVRLYDAGYNSTGNLAKCLKVENEIYVFRKIINNLSANNKISSEIEFNSSGGYIAGENGEWNDTICN